MYAPIESQQMSQENMKILASQKLGVEVPMRACEAELFEREMNELANFAAIVRETLVKTIMQVCPPEEVSPNKQAESPRMFNSGYFIRMDELANEIGKNLKTINEMIHRSAFYQD